LRDLSLKIALVAPDDFSIWHFRKYLIKALKERGCNVYAISTAGEYVGLIESLGAVHIPVEMNRFMSPMKDLKFLMALYDIFRTEKFDIVHNFTIKPNIYSAIAARVAGIKKIIGSVTGLGFVYSDNSELKLRRLRPVINKLYWLGFKLSDKVWFQNADDLAFFVSSHLIDKQKAVIIKGSGVNLQEYWLYSLDSNKIVELKKELGANALTKFVVMVVARVVWSKGVREFIEASEILKEKYPFTKFILVGPIEKGSPLSVPQEYLREKEKSENFQWLGFRKDIKEILTLSDLVVLPSYYREGIPRSLLEAMALEKPIITTNSVGCKEVVEDGKNGYLIPIKDSKALADAIEVLINDDKKRADFGRYSRLKAEKEFDEKVVVDRIIKELYEL